MALDSEIRSLVCRYRRYRKNVQSFYSPNIQIHAGVFLYNYFIFKLYAQCDIFTMITIISQAHTDRGMTTAMPTSSVRVPDQKGFRLCSILLIGFSFFHFFPTGYRYLDISK